MKNDDLTPEIYAGLLNESFSIFTQEVFQTVSPGADYMHNWHVDAICEYLMAVYDGDIRRLIINMPPRMMKSITVTIAFSAWILGKNPAAQIIAASYAQNLATSHSTSTRLVMESEWYRYAFPHTIIAHDQNEKRKFQTTKRGHRYATSVGGTITGEGGDFLILDDPIKPDEALSDVVRLSTNDWIDQVFLTRENNPRTSRAVLVMQRLHEDDPSGHLMEKGGWDSLILPAEFKKKTIIEINGNKWLRAPGEFLHEERLGEPELKIRQRDLGSYAYSGQYMQAPAPVGGGEFKQAWIQYYDPHSASFSPQGMNVYILCDPANSKKDTSDYTVFMVVGLASDNNYYILDCIKDRFNPTERIKTAIKLHQKWNKKTGKPPKVSWEAYGMMTDTFYLKKAQDDLNYRFPVVEIKSRVTKEDRIRRLIPIFESGRVYIPTKFRYTDMDGVSRELMQEFIDSEFLLFPVSKHDDMLDALAQITEEDLGAKFPRLGVVFLEAGQSLEQYLGDDKNDDDFMAW